ncbi:hypothetical protein NUU61_009402 [Penicillium alfredii]|uniref:Calponin-homology (CH) domain-containing protein n=1 Tax=Penicillium alfredii TaxID=1506179 RepID=A0A9W9JX48_9EURO|nr:uncharacterized protein NUU61_009402 [Penicillium alfredii]KAJ5084823.1 hypothetical protein NUU61_009402 [Penicillium alfredii]
MSGILNEAATPCPSRSRTSRFSERNSGSDTLETLWDDDSGVEHTGEIEFTTEVRAPVLTGARPRRANRTVSGFQIHHDTDEKPRGPAEKRRRPNELPRPPSDGKSSLLSQPAQRFRPKVNFALSPPSRSMKQETETQPRAGRVERKSNEFCRPSETRGKESDPQDREQAPKKDMRRNTVYIPPDDTTVASVFMGLFSPLKKQPGSAIPQDLEDTQTNTLEAQIAKRQARKSLAVSAKRAPLQPSSKISQEAAIRMDIAGKNGGKENIPPGTLIGDKSRATNPILLSKSNRGNAVSESNPVRRKATFQPTKSVVQPARQQRARSVLGEKQRNAGPSSACSNQQKAMPTKPKEPVRNTSTLNARASALSNRSSQSGPSRASKIGNMPSKLNHLNHEYPPLTEDISNPSLYEDNWLSHQETVITQLVNALFECTDGHLTAYDPNTLRLGLLGLYHTDYFTLLYRRIQASLTCGTLSIPKDILARHNRAKQDVGLRRKFLDIWIQSYDRRALVAAAETIVGRRVSNDSNLFGMSIQTSQESAARREKSVLRKLEGFLDTFLLRNEDIDHITAEVKDTPAEELAKAYRRTVLRSIMLVVLLDQGRQNPGIGVPRRLFASTSPFKSSAEVLQALARVLLPSCGDITKPLGHLDCHLSYQQHRLQEYNYQIDNIAIDLRDGVRLTRIVEVLFFAPERGRSSLEDQTEVSLCTGGVLPLGDEIDLPLSKHLKFPCTSRAAKVFNVQIALGALSSVKGFRATVGDLRAEHIVDGYREKTIALLWSLVSKWGLAGLVDWGDLRKDISRLKCKAVSQFGYEHIKDETWFADVDSIDDEHSQLLQQWAAVLAALKGLQIRNMTTSFADGRIYESVVDEYEPYITGNFNRVGEVTDKKPTSLSLESRLRVLGCSSQFAHLVSPSPASSHILNQDFTLAALAFLCSRLLSASKRPRAATTLQRAWRACLRERDHDRRAMAKNLAVHCAAVVQTRNEILWAKEVIVRWWRKIQARKEQEQATRYRTFRSLDRQGRKTFGRRV